MKPTKSIIGVAHHVIVAPPVSKISVIFIDISIPSIDIKLMPNAVLRAVLISICLISIIVSNITDVINPLMIAKIIISKVVQSCCMF